MSRAMVRQIAAYLGVPSPFVEELVEAHIVELDDGVLAERTVERVRVSWCLHDELGVNLAGVEVALHLLDRLHYERRLLRDDLEALRRRLGEP